MPHRYDWRPSPACAWALSALSLLAPVSVLASGLPALLAWPLAVLAALHGLGIVRGYLRLAPRRLLVPPDGAAQCDGASIDDLHVRWRGPFAFIDWRTTPSGVCQRRVFWPDQMDAPARRELRLAMRTREAASGRPSVAG